MVSKILIVLIALSLIAGCVVAPEPSSEGPLTPMEEKGWEVFRREPCYSACHVTTMASPEANNSTSFAPNLRKTPKRSRDWCQAYFVEPRAVLPNSFMPSFAHLASDEVDALTAFLQRLNREVSVPKPEPAALSEIPSIPGGLASYKTGQGVYNTYCAGCHGLSGSGGGRVGHLLSPEPRDFTDGAWMSKQSENYLFSIITDGKPNTAMPGFRDLLTATQRAAVLRYVEYFADPVSRERVEVGLVAPRK